MEKIGIVSHIETTLENGQTTVRDRVLLRSVGDRLFVDSICADEIKLYFYKSQDDIGFREFSLRNEKSFSIFVEVKELPSLRDEFIVKIGDITAEIQKSKGTWYRVSKIFKGGFVKSGNEVYLLSFEK